MEKLKISKLYPNTLIWSTVNRKVYDQMFLHYYLSPDVGRDVVDWQDYIKGNLN